ncbi:hypothetical protein AJ88_20955 [Mesorhizobium amorphae CCBAU 01583]|nr:hypothetical protein AJ88_20955 [Mesorhizobium amorphae CCBAU 01583]
MLALGTVLVLGLLGFWLDGCVPAQNSGDFQAHSVQDFLDLVYRSVQLVLLLSIVAAASISEGRSIRFWT